MTPEIKKKVDTLLIHGLYDSDDGNMKALADYLKKQGRTIQSIYYPSHGLSGDKVLSDYITPFINNNPGADIVTHSTGGLLTRMYGQQKGNTLKGRNIVMLAPPNQGTEAATNTALIKTLLKFTPGVNKFTKDIHQKKTPLLDTLDYDHVQALKMKRIEGNISILVGNKTQKKNYKHYLNNIINDTRFTTDEATDGVISPSEARLPEAKYFAEVPYGHTELLQKSDIHHKVLELLNEKKEDTLNKTAYLKGYSLSKTAGKKWTSIMDVLSGTNINKAKGHMDDLVDTVTKADTTVANRAMGDGDFNTADDLFKIIKKNSDDIKKSDKYINLKHKLWIERAKMWGSYAGATGTAFMLPRILSAKDPKNSAVYATMNNKDKIQQKYLNAGQQ